MLADGTNVYWLETGPEDDGATRSRLMKVMPPSATPSVMANRAGALMHLAFGGGRLGMLEPGSGSPGAVDVVHKTGEFYACGVSLGREALAGTDSDFFYHYLGTVFRLSGDCGGSGGVIPLASRALVAESNRLYAVVPFGQAQSALVKFRSDVGVQQADVAVQVAKLDNGITLLALDDLGVVVGNADTQTIQRFDRTSGAPTPLKSGVQDLNALAADSNGVYWGTESGAYWLPR
jgi:hypothetical protein